MNICRFRIDYFLAGGLLTLIPMVGCSNASHPYGTHPVCRWDAYQESEKSKALQYDRPAKWNEPELATILSRLMVPPEMGLSTATPPRSRFYRRGSFADDDDPAYCISKGGAAEWVSHNKSCVLLQLRKDIDAVRSMEPKKDSRSSSP